MALIYSGLLITLAGAFVLSLTYEYKPTFFENSVLITLLKGNKLVRIFMFLILIAGVYRLIMGIYLLIL